MPEKTITDVYLNRPKYWQHRANQAFFFIGGFGSASWAPLVPFLRERLAIDDATLGMLLLCIGLGSLFTMPFSGRLAGTLGLRKVIVGTVVCFSILLLILASISSIYFAVPALLLFGSFMGLLDVTVNIHAVRVEQMLGRRVMSGMHAMWSVGGFVGAGLFGIWMRLSLTPFQATCIAVGIIALLILLFARFLFTAKKHEDKGTLFAIPRGIVAFIGAITLIAFLVEGAIMDWSGVFLTTVRNLPMEDAGEGFAAFSAAMLTMRLLGDRLVSKLGAKPVVLWGSALAICGFLLVIFAPIEALLFLGFFLIGIGAANVVPVFYSLLGKQDVMTVSAAVSAVSTLGYLGILMGPAAIGFIAQHTSLYASFGLLAFLVFCQLLIGAYVYHRLE